MAKRGPRLESLNDVSKFMARLIRETYTDRLDPTKAGRLAYMCNILRGCMEASDIERRVEEIEAILKATGSIAPTGI